MPSEQPRPPPGPLLLLSPPELPLLPLSEGCCPLPTWTVIVEPRTASHGVISVTMSRGPGTSCRSTLNPSRLSTVETAWNDRPLASLQYVLTSWPVGDVLGCPVCVAPPVWPPPLVAVWVGLPLVVLALRYTCRPTQPRPSRTSTPMSTPRMIMVLRPLLRGGVGGPTRYPVSGRGGGGGGTDAAPRQPPAAPAAGIGAPPRVAALVGNPAAGMTRVPPAAGGRGVPTPVGPGEVCDGTGGPETGEPAGPMEVEGPARPAATRRACWPKADAVGNRADGSFAMARPTMSRTAGGMSPGSGGGCSRTCFMA